MSLYASAAPINFEEAFAQWEQEQMDVNPHIHNQRDYDGEQHINDVARDEWERCKTEMIENNIDYLLDLSDD